MVVVALDPVDHLSAKASIHINLIVPGVHDHGLTFARLRVEVKAHFSSLPLKR
jgi:hypothetical protein